MSKVKEIIEKYKKETNALVRKVDKDIAAIKSLDKTLNAAEFIKLMLYKLSAQCALYVYIVQQKELMLFQDVDNLLQALKKIVDLQKSHRKHKGISITNLEICENFVFWTPINRNVLYDFLIKEHYLLLLISDIFAKNARWIIPVTNLHCDIAICTQNFIDMKLLLSQDSRNKNFNIVQKTIDLATNLLISASDECIRAHSYNEGNFQWYSKALHLLEASKHNFTLLQKQNDIETVEEKIESLRKRIINHPRYNQGNDGSNIISEKLHTMSLEKLLEHTYIEI